MSYNYQEYWNDLHRRADLSAVGQSAFSDDINKWIYRSTRRNLRRFVRRHNLTATGSRRMLEVGVGTGYWVDFWQGYGWAVDGCDLVADAVEQLRDKHPDAQFWQADVGSPGGVLAPSGGRAAESYDLVVAAHVLLHVTEDEAFERALANVAAAVRPGGYLLLLEPALTIKKKELSYSPEHSSRARLLRSYRRPLRGHGLKLVTVEASTVLASNPIEAGSKRKRRAYWRWWRLVGRTRIRPSMVRLVGPAMYLLDGVLIRTREAPTSKILLFRRPA